jgi:DNA-binding transcriptional regulator YhcF (GntR family)
MTSPLHGLGDMDPDDPRPASQQIAGILRAAIRTGQFPPGERLPSQNELSERYGVARETVKSALRLLREDRLIVTRPGSGAFVRAQTKRPVGLRPHVESAFSRDQVTLDFAGFSAETLHGVLAEPLDKVRAGSLVPQSIHMRLLLPDTAQVMALPQRADTGADDPAVRQRAERIMRRHTEAISDSVAELADLGLVKSAGIEVRLHGAVPLFKLYVLNGEEAFFGFYPVVKHTITIKGEQVEIFDLMGKDATLFHFAPTDDEGSNDAQFIEQAQLWFNSMWETVAREATAS